MEEFKIGEEVELKVYSYDDQGNEYKRIAKGKVYQITNSFVVLDNGKYKESFKYCEFKKCQPGNIEGEPYDLSLESYSEDVIKQCLLMLKNNQEGFVFNSTQLNEVINYIKPNEYTTREKDGIYYIKKY